MCQPGSQGQDLNAQALASILGDFSGIWTLARFKDLLGGHLCTYVHTSLSFPPLSRLPTALVDLFPFDHGEGKSGTINKVPHNGGKKWPTRSTSDSDGEMRGEGENLMKGKIPRCTQISLRQAITRMLTYSQSVRVQFPVRMQNLKVLSLWVGIGWTRDPRSQTT